MVQNLIQNGFSLRFDSNQSFFLSDFSRKMIRHTVFFFVFWFWVNFCDNSDSPFVLLDSKSPFVERLFFSKFLSKFDSAWFLYRNLFLTMSIFFLRELIMSRNLIEFLSNLGSEWNFAWVISILKWLFVENRLNIEIFSKWHIE